MKMFSSREKESLIISRTTKKNYLAYNVEREGIMVKEASKNFQKRPLKF